MSLRGSYLASTLTQDLQGQLQLALTLPDTPQRPMLVGGHNAWGVATVSINPNARSTGAATISINPARHTSKANASQPVWGQCSSGSYN